MEILGYKYAKEVDAIEARTLCAKHYGLPKKKGDTTKYWVDYSESELDSPVFWYIAFHKSIEDVLGKPVLFESKIEPPKK